MRFFYEEFHSLFNNKLASALILVAAFFVTLSVKVTPEVYTYRELGWFNPLFDTFEIFPLSLFDYCLWFVCFLILHFAVKFIAYRLHFYTFMKVCGNKSYLWLTIFLFLAWTPYFLAFYPGASMQDEIYVMRAPFESSNQPLFYNYLLKFVWDFGIYFGDELLGFAIFVVFKMFFTAFSIAYLLIFLYKRGISKYFLAIFGIMFAFLPIFPNYAISISKDGFFAVFILFLTLFLYEYKNNVGKIFTENKAFVLFFILSLTTVWLRGNGLYVMLGIVLTLGFLAENARLRMFLLTIIILLAGILPNLNRNVPFKETVGIPLQQIARTINMNGEIDDEEKEVFNNVLALNLFKDCYVAFGVDTIKGQEAFNNEYLNKHKKEFLTAWIKTFPKNISTYLTAHAFATYEFWAISPWQMFTMEGFWSDSSLKGYVNQTIFPHAITKEGLHNEDIAKEGWNYRLVTSEGEILPQNVKHSIAVFMQDNIFYINGGVCGIMLLLLTAISLYRGQKSRVIATLPVFFAWGTILVASPIASSFRYVFYFALLTPFILSLPFMTKEGR